MQLIQRSAALQDGGIMRPVLALPFNVLRFHASAALREARRLHSEGAEQFSNDPVNWADLSVHTVEFWECDTGHVGWRVYVSEASPGAGALRRFVMAYLRDRGMLDVDVVTEW